LRFPSWSEFKEGFSKYEQKVTDTFDEVNDKVGDFKEKHKLIDKGIKFGISFLPFPLNGIAQGVYNSFDGTPEEKTNAVTKYLKEIQVKEAEHYEETTLKLDSILIKIKNSEEVTEKQIELFKKCLITSDSNQNQLLEEFKAVHKRFDDIDKKLEEIQTEMCTMLQQQNISTQIDRDVHLKLTKGFKEKIQRLEDEKSRLQKELKKAGQTPKIDADLLLRESNFYFSKKEYDKTITFADAVLAVDSKNYLAWFNKGYALDELEKYDDAIESYDKAVQIKPDYHEAWYNRGISLYELERHDDAIESYDKAVKIKPDYQDVKYNLKLAKKYLAESQK